MKTELFIKVNVKLPWYCRALVKVGGWIAVFGLWMCDKAMDNVEIEVEK